MQKVVSKTNSDSDIVYEYEGQFQSLSPSHTISGVSLTSKGLGQPKIFNDFPRLIYGIADEELIDSRPMSVLLMDNYETSKYGQRHAKDYPRDNGGPVQ